MHSILIVEDNDQKIRDIVSIINGVAVEATFEEINIDFAKDILTGEMKIDECDWDLIILDMTMNIKDRGMGIEHGGHQSTGGLTIANRMRLTKRKFPTIILTAFDYFSKSSIKEGGASEVIGLEDIEQEASSILADAYLGTIQYGSKEWDVKFAELFSSSLSREA